MDKTTSPTQDQTKGDWPGAFGLYKTAKRATKLNVSTILVLAAIYAVIFIVLGLLFPDRTVATDASHAARITFSPADLLGLLVSTVLTTAFVSTFLASADGEKFSFDQAKKLFGKYYLKMLGLIILSNIIMVISFAALIVPFFFIAPRIYLAQYFLVDQKLGPIEALKASWHATKGHVGKLWGIFGANLAMGLLFVTIIGIPFAIYFIFMYSAASAILYRYITGKNIQLVQKRVLQKQG